MPTRVVITGLGCVSAFGPGHDALWSALVEGRSAIRRITRFDPSGFPSRLAGEIADLDARDYVPKNYRKATKVMARDTEIAVAAAKLAVEDAGLVTRGNAEAAEGTEDAEKALTYRKDRMGCNIGAGLIAAQTDEMAAAMVTAREVEEGGTENTALESRATSEGRFTLRAWGGEGGRGMEALTPLWLLKYLPNMLACHVTIIHGAEGPSNTITCAEASGLLSIGESTRIIERGAADMCFSGAAESKLNPMGMLRLDFAGRLAATGESEDGASFVRPFDAGARGGLVGEGGAIVILENAQTAADRGARVYAQVAGFGSGHSDPRYKHGERDEGYRYAIENALEDAGVKPEQIDVIVPLGMGVAEMDRPELGALRGVFGARLSGIPMITIQPNAGNCVAGAGGLQMVAAALALKNQRLPARIHAGTPVSGPAAGAAPARDAKLQYALLCSGSLGGQNAAVVLKAVG
jgi:3-oxoacyl-[acyl-carrier-protein] synthase II